MLKPKFQLGQKVKALIEGKEIAGEICEIKARTIYAYQKGTIVDQESKIAYRITGSKALIHEDLILLYES